VNGALPPKRIVVNALSSRSGGGVTYINNLLRGLDPRQAEVFVVAAHQRSLCPRVIELAEGVIHRLWERWAPRQRGFEPTCTSLRAAAWWRGLRAGAAQSSLFATCCPSLRPITASIRSAIPGFAFSCFGIFRRGPSRALNW
jgi:hypothetical protein